MRISEQRQQHLLLTYLRPQGARVGFLAVLLFGGIGLELLNPQILRGFIDTAASGGPLAQLTRAALLFIGVALMQQVISVAAAYVSQNVGWTATNALRSDLLAHCLGLDLAFHKAHTPGEMIERVDGDVTALATFFSQFVILVLGNLLLLIGVLVLLFIEEWRVGLALTGFALFALWVLSRTSDFAVPAMTAEREASAGLFGFIEERLSGLDDIRANGGGAYTARRYYAVERERFGKARRAMQHGTMIWVTTNSLFVLGSALTLGLGAYLFSLGSITIGTVYLFFQYTALLRTPLEQITDQLREFQKASAGMTRIRQLARVQPTVHGGTTARLSAGALGVEFDHVRFAYVDEAPLAQQSAATPDETTIELQPAVLADLSFALEPGRVLGLLGRTGSGKTTLTRLLFRLYDINGGAIRLGGVDLRDVPLDDLRTRVGIVTQDVQLFQASVRDNLTFFDQTISDERILAVLRELELDGWLHALPNGLSTELAANGGGLSAGESQLLAFARVFLQDPGLVLLDEASSRLDPATERLIEHAVSKLLHGRTGIIIAHRLATVQRADEIMILDNGHVYEHGSRAALADDPTSRFAHLLRTGMEDVLV